MPSNLPGWATGMVARVIGFILLALVIFFVLGRVGFKFDPFGWGEKKLENVTAERDYAVVDADARGLEVEGERGSAQRVDAYTHLVIDTSAITAAASAEAWSATDAKAPLDPDLDSRLRDVDRRLCERAPASCAAARPAQDRDASGGPADVPLADAPAGGDTG